MSVRNPIPPLSDARPFFGRLLLATACVLLLATSAVAQTTVYAKVPDTKIRADATATAALVATVDPGTALTVLATQGPRYRVRTPDGKVGFVSRLHVSDTRPSGGGLLSGLARSEVQADEAQTVASIRGLSPAAKQLALDEGLSRQAVQWAEKMETDSARITPAQVEDFLRAENIGW